MILKPKGPRAKKPLGRIPQILLFVLAGDLLLIILSAVWFMLEGD
jgi:hypothetical protein